MQERSSEGADTSNAESPLSHVSRLSKWGPLAATVIVSLLVFFLLPPLNRSGLWDPHELNVADLARRVAVNLHGASNLALSGADNSLPHLNDLGRPQLPITSVALGFKLFGLHEWAGRLPLAVWGLLGVLATYGFVARLFDKRTGLYAALALATTPVYFVQARSILGEVVTMASVAMAFGGLAVWLFDRDERGNPAPGSSRLPWLLLGILGIVCGVFARGALLGAAVPLSAVGVGAMLSGRGRDPVAIASVGLGLLFVTLGVSAMVSGDKDLSMLVGALPKAPARYPTFDVMIAHVGHALVPWSAFFPFALGRLFQPSLSTGPSNEKESGTRTALVIGAAFALAMHGFLLAKVELIAFTGVVFVAVICAIAIREFERGAHASVAVGLGTAVLCGVFHHDFHELPEKAFQAFGVTSGTFPESFKAPALLLWWVVLFGFAAVAFLTWVERDSTRTPFDPKNYTSILRTLGSAYDGGLALTYYATVVGLGVAALVVFVGLRLQAKWAWLVTMGSMVRDIALNAWWVVALAPVLAILFVFFLCDLWLWAFGRTKPLSVASLTRGFEPLEVAMRAARDGGLGREDRAVSLGLVVAMITPGAAITAAFLHTAKHYGWGISFAIGLPAGVAGMLGMGLLGDLVKHRAPVLAVAGALFGLVLSAEYYPALANQLSPKEVFESYQRLRKEGEPLGLFGVGGRTSAYYAGGEPPMFQDAQGAYQWLTGGENRRFIAMKADELAKLNHAHRERTTPRENIPVMDARSSQILLVASRLSPGEKNENPLSPLILSAAPVPHRKLDVNLEDKLQVLGFDLTDKDGKRVEGVTPGRSYVIHTYFKVLAPVGSEWEMFIHIDGFKRRHNGDHKIVQQKVPMALWLKDDVMVDKYDLKLEPNFSPGQYQIFMGLYVGDTRMKVKTGAHDGENRINAGNLKVQ